MNYGKLDICDSANGIGVRVSLFVSGCTHHCKGCFNKDTWDFAYGKPFTNKELELIINKLKLPYYDGFTILGGEPMEISNQPEVLHLIKEIRAKCKDKTIWIYSGYTYEELIDINNKKCYLGKITQEILSNIDVLVDGEFILEQKKLGLAYRGSANQRLIDIQKTLKNNKIYLLENIKDKNYK